MVKALKRKTTGKVYHVLSEFTEDYEHCISAYYIIADIETGLLKKIDVNHLIENYFYVNTSL